VRGDRPLPSRQRVLVFSPHPDDDVISMGGILRKLWENENAIVVAYMVQDVKRMIRESEYYAMEAYRILKP
jgi:LmbE family N-acetylglucosaminyl deacetylase